MDASPNFPQFTRQHKIIILNINFSSFVCAQQSQPREHRFNDSFGLEGKRDDVGDFVEIFSFEGQRSRPAIIPLRWTEKASNGSSENCWKLQEFSVQWLEMRGRIKLSTGCRRSLIRKSRAIDLIRFAPCRCELMMWIYYFPLESK